MHETLISSSSPIPVDLLSSRVSRLGNQITKQDGDLRKAAQEFEAVFIAQLLKVMRETIEESGLTEGGFGKSIYTELFDQELSMSMARRGTLGISDLLYRNLSAVEAEPPVQSPGRQETGHSSHEPEISDLQLPVHAPISSHFGMRKDPISHQRRFHKGLDLAAPEGTKVMAALAGRVISAGYENGYGNNVLVQHSDGLQTRYGHLKEINVKAGDSVTTEHIIGAVGNTGRSTGPHLHFEVIRMGQEVDPVPVLNSRNTGAKPAPGV